MTLCKEDNFEALITTYGKRKTGSIQRWCFSNYYHHHGIGIKNSAWRSLSDLKPLLPVLVSYILGFIYIGIYWNNHHHMLHAVQKVNGSVLWTNAHLLFWLSLVPFVTGWMGENHFTTIPVAMYGFVLMMAGIAYYFLAHCLTSLHGKQSSFTKALGSDRKGKISVALYAVGIALCFVHPMIGFALYVAVAIIWIVPDKRFEYKANG